MGLWSEHFHPKILLAWEALGWILACLITVGGVVLTVDQFLIANICFALAALFFAAKIIHVASTYRGSSVNALIFAFVLCGIVGVAITATVRGVNRFRDKRSSETATHGTPSLEAAELKPPQSTSSSKEEVAKENPVSSSHNALPKAKATPVSVPLLPEIAATFVQGTSPGLLVVNPSKATIKSPVAHFAMWNLSRVPPLMIPTWDVQQIESFIKPNSGLIWATADTPQAKPYISAGDEVFALITVDCPDCKASRSYYLHFVYGQGQSGWFSEIPEGTAINVLLVNSRMQDVSWNVQDYMHKVEHGPILSAELPNGLIRSAQQQ